VYMNRFSLRKSGGNLPEEDVDDEEDLPPIEVKPNEHRLQHTYGLWYIGKTNYQQYDFSLKKIGRFASVEQFWALYSHLVRPSDFNSPADFYIFKDGIKPMWEHKGNRDGGQWLVRLHKGLAARCWENLILAILGEQFDVGDEICGAGISMRPKKDCISLWNKTSSDHDTTDKIRETLRKVLNLPAHIDMEYRYHRDFLSWLNQRQYEKNEAGGVAPGGGGGDAPGPAPVMPRTPTGPGTGIGFNPKPRSTSPPHFDRGDRERERDSIPSGGRGVGSGGGGPPNLQQQSSSSSYASHAHR